MPEGDSAPDPASAADQAEFRVLCRELMRWAGYRTIRDLVEGAERCGVVLPRATIDRALKNDGLPTEEFVGKLAVACGVDPTGWVDARQALEDQKYLRVAPEAPQPEVDPRECPYPGLAAFSTESARYFHGRESVTATLVSLLGRRLDGGGPLVVGGPSGAGKSSLLRAGLLAALADGRLPGSRGWARLVCTPGARPLDALAEVLASEVGQAREVVRGRLADDPAALGAGLEGTPAVVIVVDQFEELFTLCPDEAQRRCFVRALAELASPGQASPPAALVALGVRADHYPGLAEHPELTDALRHGQLMLGPMTRAELVTAIERPAGAAGLRLDPGLTELLLADLGIAEGRGYSAGALPLLAQALRNTWEQRTDPVLTVAGYRLTGGISGAVAHTAQLAYDGLAPAAREVAKAMLLELIQLGEGREHARRRVDPAALVAGAVDPAEAQAVLERLIACRLVSVSGGEVEIVHEALLYAWPLLREWLEEDRAGLMLERRFIEAANLWHAGGRHESELFFGPRLAALAERAGADRAGENSGEDRGGADGETRGDRVRGLGPLAGEYLRASLERERELERQAQRGVTRLRLLVAVLSVLLLVAGSATVLAVSARADLLGQRDAGQSREVAGASIGLRGSQPALAAQLAVAAYRLSPTAEARGAMLSALITLDPARRSNADSTDAVRSVAFSPRGELLATASDDRTARIWRFDEPDTQPDLVRPSMLLEHPAKVRTVVFDPGGRFLATSSFDNTVRLWSAEDLRHGTVPAAPVVALPASAGPLAFSREARLLATGGPTPDTVRVWDLGAATPTPVAELRGHRTGVLTAAFGPGGLLATGGLDGTARLWHPAEGQQESRVLTQRAGFVYSVAFSPDGSVLGIGLGDTTARLWDVHDPTAPTELAVLRGHSGPVSGIAFAPDGRQLATTSHDTTAQLWDVSDPHHPTPWARPLTGDTDNLYAAAFSPDGHSMATASHGLTVHLWETDPQRAASAICALAPRPPSAEDWRRHLPEHDYRPPCAPPPSHSTTTADPGPMPGATELVAGHSQRCVAANENGELRPAYQAGCAAPGTRWQLRAQPSAGPDTYQLANVGSGLCLQASAAEPLLGQARLAVQRPCVANPDQLWRLDVHQRRVDSLDVRFVSVGEPGCLDVYREGGADGTRLVRYPCAEPPRRNQIFAIAADAIPH